MTDTPRPFMPEEDFAKMFAGALAAHGIENGLVGVLSKARGNGNGSSLIALPGGNAVRMNVPSAQELGLMNMEAIRVALQSLRILLVAVNDLDSRLRSLNPPAAAPEMCGIIHGGILANGLPHRVGECPQTKAP